ncbi:ent-kaurene oxidase [Fusarium napiforme]|uniref:Ent-kaurene oxidase n=1 Tax=Fusarium napiforme TaxID=42672 RepID=A0A8H5NCW7_9HYPO|nr:ent-kaurene oxidase [Fusarium napiforme]
MADLLLFAFVLLVIGWFGWQRNTKNSGFYETLPCVGVREDEWFVWTRAKLRSFSKTEEWMKEGVLTTQSTLHHPLILPPAQLKAIYNKCEDELLAHDPASEALSFEWTIRDREVFPSSYTVDVIRKWITKRFDEFSAELQEELCLAVDEQFGMSQEWREVRLWPAAQRIFTRGLNRVLVGFPLCRDEAFLETMRRFAIDMPFQGLFITLVPKVLKPIFAPLISWNARRDTEAGIKYCTQIIQDYLKANRNSTSEKPVNILQWIIEASAATGDPSQLDVHRIGHRMMILNFNLVQGGSIPFSTVLSDISNGEHAAQTFSQLRDEATLVLASAKIWDRATISKLVVADSAVRESMRWSDFGLFALPRRVNSPGITLDNGIYVRPGVHIEVPMHGIHMDEDLYADAATFKPFRFADGTSPSRSAVTLDESFLGFGYGRNACPGWFFGSHVIKVILAYIVMNYDVNFGDEEPPMQAIWEYRIPRESTAIKMRRRIQARNPT